MGFKLIIIGQEQIRYIVEVCICVSCVYCRQPHPPHPHPLTEVPQWVDLPPEFLTPTPPTPTPPPAMQVMGSGASAYQTLFR